jgi:predicted metal-binding protein
MAVDPPFSPERPFAQAGSNARPPHAAKAGEPPGSAGSAAKIAAQPRLALAAPRSPAHAAKAGLTPQRPPHAATIVQPRLAEHAARSFGRLPASLLGGAVLQRSTAVAPVAATPQIGIEYDDEGKEYEQTLWVQPKKLYSTLVVDFGLPRTMRLNTKLQAYATKKAIFSDHAELIEVLALGGVPTLTVEQQAQDVIAARSKARDSNFANAYVVVEATGAPVFTTKVHGSKRVGNSAYVYVATESKKLSRDIDQSQNDSEIGVLQEIHDFLFQDTIAKPIKTGKFPVYVRIVSNMGPCDGCKARIQKLKGLCDQQLGANLVTVDVYYFSDPGVAKNRDCSTYGWSKDKQEQAGTRYGAYVHRGA